MFLAVERAGMLEKVAMALAMNPLSPPLLATLVWAVQEALAFQGHHLAALDCMALVLLALAEPWVVPKVVRPAQARADRVVLTVRSCQLFAPLAWLFRELEHRSSMPPLWISPTAATAQCELYSAWDVLSLQLMWAWDKYD
jgi:hypothetical protein